MRRLALWLAAAAGATMLWASYVPVPVHGRLDAVAPFTQLLAVRPAIATVLGLAAVAGLVRTWRRAADAAPLLALLACAVLAWVQIAPRAIGDSAPRSGAGFTVLTANTLRSSVAPRTILELVGRTGADVVAVTELNTARAAALARALSAARGERWQAYGDRVSAPAEASARPTSLLVRAALGPRRLADPAAALRAHAQVRVRLTRVPGRSGRTAGPALAAVHAVPPAPVASQRDWRRDILALRPLCEQGWVVAGDLNATLDHSPVRALGRAGCTDAAAATGQGLRTTWTGGPFGVFRLVLDHVLTSGRWRATASGVLPIAGSDHRAVWARIAER